MYLHRSSRAHQKIPGGPTLGVTLIAWETVLAVLLDGLSPSVRIVTSGSESRRIIRRHDGQWNGCKQASQQQAI